MRRNHTIWTDPTNHQPAAGPPGKPAAAHQFLVSLAHRIVMNVALPAQGTHTRQRIACLKLAGCNQKYDLVGELLSQRNLALLTQHDPHSWPSSTRTSNSPHTPASPASPL